MTLADFLATWRGLTLENRLHRLAVLGLIGTNLITAVALLRADHTVVLVPPVLESEWRQNDTHGLPHQPVYLLGFGEGHSHEHISQAADLTIEFSALPDVECRAPLAALQRGAQARHQQVLDA